MFPVHLFVTGGTLDKDYDPISGELTFPASCIPSLLEEARCGLAMTVEVLFEKDSLQMTEEDRDRINQACEVCPENHIVITHGTDTMVETAKALQHNSKLFDKTIVLTGAMRPYRLSQSDASFNMGSALMAAQIAGPGVFIAMNGRLFRADQVKKNLSAGIFETL